MAFFIGNPNFQMLTPDQTNPFQSGLTKALAQHLSMQNVRKNRKMMPFITPNAQADLQGKQLNNQKTDLANKLAQMQLPYGVQDLLSQIGLRSAQTNQANANAQGQAITNQYLPQQSQANIGQTQAMTNYYNMGGPGMGVEAKDLMGLKRQLKIDHPDWSQSQIEDAAGQYLNGQQTFTNGKSLPQPSGLVQAFLDNSTKQNNTAEGLNQQRYAGNLKSAIDSADKVFPLAKEYSGLPGKTKKALDQAFAQTGKADPKLAAYNQFTQVAVPMIATELLRVAGAHSTDQQKLTAILQADPTKTAQNPALAQQQWDYMKDAYRRLSKNVAASPTQIKGQLLNDNGDTNISSAPSATISAGDESKIQDAMKKHGLTRDKAIEVLKATGLIQ